MQYININLIPWRDQRRQRIHRHFISALAVVVGLSVISFFWIYYHHRTHYVFESRWREKLQQKLADLTNKELELTTLLQSSDRVVVKKAKQSAIRVQKFVGLLKFLSRHPVSGIYLWRAQLLPKCFLLKGKTQSEKLLALLIRRLNSQGWKIHLQNIRRNQKEISFALQLA